MEDLETSFSCCLAVTTKHETSMTICSHRRRLKEFEEKAEMNKCKTL